jgi:hypothetical protein
MAAFRADVKFIVEVNKAWSLIDVNADKSGVDRTVGFGLCTEEFVISVRGFCHN